MNSTTHARVLRLLHAFTVVGVLSAPIVSPIRAFGQESAVRWERESLEWSVAPGEMATVTVSLTLSKPMTGFDVVLTSASGDELSRRITPAVRAFGDAAAGVRLVISLLATTPGDDKGSYRGSLDIRSGGVTIGALPVTLVVTQVTYPIACVPKDQNGPARLTSQGRDAPSLETRSTTYEERTFTVPSQGCRIAVELAANGALPSPAAAHGSRVVARTVAQSALLRIALRTADAAEPQRGAFFSSSDTARADQQLAIPDGFKGWLELARMDLSEASVDVDVSLVGNLLTHDESLARSVLFLDELASPGHAFRTDLTVAQHNDLMDLAMTYRSRQRTKPAAKAAAYRLISDLLARRITNEKIKQETLTEPVVAFLGLSGMNRVVLIDCVSWPAGDENQPTTDCKRFAESWQTNFERAHHFWAVYIEDEQTGFETSIDVEFPRSSRSSDYDDFDPLNAGRGVSTLETGSRRVRVGYRRFTMPSRRNLVRVTFSRQSASYGLKSWSREYERYGVVPISFAGSVAVPGWLIARRQLELSDVYTGDSLEPNAVLVTEKRTRQPILAMGSIRVNKVRAAAKQSSGIGLQFMPDVAFGIALPWITGASLKEQTLVLGLSWPLGLGDRVHFFAGTVSTRAIDGDPPVGRRFPAGTTLDELRTVSQRWRPIVGLSVDIARLF